MKTIGLLGGMSWESSLHYYRLINEATKARLGGLHSAKCVLYSLDFADIEPLQSQAMWSEAADEMISAAKHVERIEVRWPSGVVQTLTEVAVDQRLVIREPDGGSEAGAGSPQP